MITRSNSRNVLAIAVAMAVSGSAFADAAYDDLKRQVELLQQQLQQVQKTLNQYQQQSASKDEVATLKQQVAKASADATEWKNTDSTVHHAGYGDVTFSDGQGSSPTFSAARFNPIFHYQYKDLLVLESELAIEVAANGASTVDLEYLTVDYLLNDNVAFAAGKFLSPIGQFRQNLHPSWINKLPTAPSGFGHDEAAPITGMGLMARGGFELGGEDSFVNYAAFVGNGPVLTITGGAIEAIETAGRISNTDDALVWGGRIGVVPLPKMELGLSLAVGKVAGDAEPLVTRDYNVYGADASYSNGGWGLRAEYVKQAVGAQAASAAPGSAAWSAWYGQGSYKFAQSNWEGVVRYSDYNANDNALDQTQWALGLNYWIAANAAIKSAINFNDNDLGTAAANDVYQIQFSYGF